MAREAVPAFQFYPKDFLSDGKQAAMSLPAVGAYIRLLAICWLELSIPDDAVRCARMVGATPAQMKPLWAELRHCFIVQPGDPTRLVHPRLEKEREKQVSFRERQSHNGIRGGRPKAKPDESQTKPTGNPDVTQGITQTKATPNPNESFPISVSEVLASQVPSPLPPSTSPNGRGKRPVYTGNRLVVFDWQLEDLMQMLGNHAVSFRLDLWFQTLDQRLMASGEVLPKRDGGAWLQQETLAEARRRGLPFAGEDEDDPYKHFTTAWQCRCGEVHEGTKEQARRRECLKVRAAAQ